MSHIVELCSAANGVEAYAIAGALEAAGIKAEVVGEVLQGAAGGLPLGETTAPRVWVPEESEARALEVLAEYRAAASRGAPDASADEDSTAECVEAESAASEAEPEAEAQPGHDVSLLTVILTLIGMGSVVVGAYYGYANHRWLAHYSAETVASLLSASATENPSAYGYTVNGHLQQLTVYREGGLPAPSIAVRYDPDNPADYRLGDVLPPVWCLLSGIGLGVFLLFLAYQFR